MGMETNAHHITVQVGSITLNLDDNIEGKGPLMQTLLVNEANVAEAEYPRINRYLKDLELAIIALNKRIRN